MNEHKPTDPEDQPLVAGPYEPVSEEPAADKPVSEHEPAPRVSDVEIEEIPDDRLTVHEGVESVKQIGQTAKEGLLKPAWKLGRRYLRSAQQATEAFFDGVNEKGSKK